MKCCTGKGVFFPPYLFFNQNKRFGAKLEKVVPQFLFCPFGKYSINNFLRCWYPDQFLSSFITKCQKDTHSVNNQGVLQMSATASQDCLQPQKTGKGEEGSSSRDFREGRAPLTPQFQISSFQNCETINFCCSETPGLWSFVMVALGN